MSAEFDQLVAQFEKFQSRLKHIDTRFAGVDQMQEAIGAMEASATSPDRSVTVVAGPGGSIKAINLTPDAMRQQPSALSAAILSTLHQAVAEAAHQQARIVEQHMGGDMRVVDQVLDAQATAFGVDAEEPRTRRADTEQAHAQDDDFQDESMFGRNTEQAPRELREPREPSSGLSQADQFLRNLNDDY